MASIIEQAIHLEVTAEANYREAALQTTDPSAGAILELLANEEAEHGKTLRGMSDVAHLRGSDLLEKAKTWIRGVVEGELTTLSPDTDLPSTLRRAMDIEQMTELFYRENAASSDEPAVVELFTTLADIEKKHFVLVGSLVEYFDRPNEWIESAEFGLRNDY